MRVQRANLALASVANFDFIYGTSSEEKRPAFKTAYILPCVKWKVASGTWRLHCRRRSRDRHSITLRWTSWNYALINTHFYCKVRWIGWWWMLFKPGAHLVLCVAPQALTRNQQRCLTFRWSNFSLVPLAGIHFACTRTQSGPIMLFPVVTRPQIPSSLSPHSERFSSRASNFHFLKHLKRPHLRNG